jgi:hypothetical protein
MKTKPTFVLYDGELTLVGEDITENIDLNMADIIELGIKESLKKLNANIDEDYIKEQACRIVTEQKRDQEIYNDNNQILMHLKDDLHHFNRHKNYGNDVFKNFHTYLEQVLTQQITVYTQPFDDLLKTFPTEFNTEEYYNVEINNKNYNLKPITQQHKTSCGLTCVAMLTSQPYDEIIQKARELFTWHKNRPKFRATIDHLRQLLSHYGITNHEYTVDYNWKNCSDLSIAVINRDHYTNKSINCHAVIFFRKNNQEYVIDPAWENGIRTDFHNMNLDSFISLY